MVIPVGELGPGLRSKDRMSASIVVILHAGSYWPRRTLRYSPLLGHMPGRNTWSINPMVGGPAGHLLLNERSSWKTFLLKGALEGLKTMVP